MSFRHTYITDFLYRGGETGEESLKNIEETLNKYGTVNKEFRGVEGWGYFHGIIKDLDSYETKEKEEEIIETLKDLGVNLKIVYES